MEKQNTAEWMKARLGRFNGSAIGELMTKGKKNGEVFGKVALTYIFQIASERDLISAYKEDDYLWEMYQSQVSSYSKYFDWGHEQEPFAIEGYEKRTGRMC